MTGFQTFLCVFVLGILGIFALAGAWNRLLEYKLKKQFMQDQKEHMQQQIDDKVNEFFKLNRKEEDKDK